MVGHVFHCFWMALLLSPWTCDAMYDGVVEDMYYNVMVAYYLACANVAMLDKKFGSKWEQHFIPIATFVNSMALAGQFAGRCLYWPEDIPFMPSKTSERIAEIFFAWAKAACKGMPREKDMIYGSLGIFNGKCYSMPFQFYPSLSDSAHSAPTPTPPTPTPLHPLHPDRVHSLVWPLMMHTHHHHYII